MLNLKRKEEEKFFFSPYRPVDPYLLYIPIMKSRLSGFRRKEEKKKKEKTNQKLLCDKYLFSAKQRSKWANCKRQLLLKQSYMVQLYTQRGD